ncbi:hypothetical protein LX36DRAFT_383387 [Colletotrichum falcatum]|nr:hypothetical protein LX36DRAFT_383387 [Colletotrichum falcatum]
MPTQGGGERERGLQPHPPIPMDRNFGPEPLKDTRQSHVSTFHRTNTSSGILRPVLFPKLFLTSHAPTLDHCSKNTTAIQLTSLPLLPYLSSPTPANHMVTDKRATAYSVQGPPDATRGGVKTNRKAASPRFHIVPERSLCRGLTSYICASISSFRLALFLSLSLFPPPLCLPLSLSVSRQNSQVTPHSCFLPRGPAR